MPEVRISLPDDGDEFEFITQFAGSPRGGTIDSTSGELKVPIGVPFASKYHALKVTDRPGEMLYFVVFGRVHRDHYGDADEPDDRDATGGDES